jgi:hypothetical protein
MTAPNPAPRLRIIANLWSLWDYPSAKREWSLEKKVAAVKEAGFDGFSGVMGKDHHRLARKYDLCTVGFISSDKPSEFATLIRKNIDGGARRINVQLANHDTPMEEAIQMAVRIVAEGDRLGVPCDIEIHRDTSTETPEKTYAIAAAFRERTGRLLPMTWDFSHFAVVKHLRPPFWERLIEDEALIQHALQFHFRPFNGHHCQVPVTNGRGRRSLEFNEWIPVLDKTLETWLAVDQSGREVFACPELGPVRGGYNLAQLPNSWDDAKILRGIIEKTWKRVSR